MGWVRIREGARGTRYEARFRDVGGSVRSAGSYRTQREAEKAWQRAEARQEEGRPNLSRHGAVRFETYALERWLPHHVVEPTTREGYYYVLRRHLLPFFGAMRLLDVTAPVVREWVSWMTSRDVSPATVRHCRTVLSALFTTAVNDQLLLFHPVKGVKTPTVPVKEYRILTPAEYARLLAALPTGMPRLLVEVAVESGLRWGELTELRVRDVDLATRIVTVSRAACQVDPKHHPDGQRFYVKPYPKSRRSRRLKLSTHVISALQQHIDRHALGDDDLLFWFAGDPRPALALVCSPAARGMTEPNEHGRRYPHGTLSAYSAGGCRCEHCRRAYADYRARRRAAGADEPRQPRRRASDGHLPRDWFMRRVFAPAVQRAGLRHVRFHDLRHAHASWLLAGGADLQVVKERLGHSSIATTEKYLHTLPTADDSALSALDAILGRRR